MVSGKKILMALAATVVLSSAAARAEVGLDAPSIDAADTHGGERMNGMVGLFYSTYNQFGFEYDLIAQFQKSKQWMGNFTGPYLSDEVFMHANRFGAGFALGMRQPEKGTFGICFTGFAENRYSQFSHTDWGEEMKITLAVFGVKIGLLNQDKLYFELGLSY